MNELRQKTPGGQGGGHNPEIPITIDGKPYKATAEQMTGAQIRALANPAIGADRDLFLATRGPGDDQKIGDSQVVTLKPGDRFFSAPRAINPGADAPR